MDFQEFAGDIVAMQEILHSLTDERDVRHKVLKLMQVSEDQDVVLTLEIIERELADLKKVIDVPAEEVEEKETETG